MPWLPMYLHAIDVKIVLDRLDGDKELAWIIPRGPGRWIAVPKHPRLAGYEYGRYALWHVPSGPLPLIASQGQARTSEAWIDDPWKGWNELRPGADPQVPYFGAGHSGVYWLNLRVAASPVEGLARIGMSSFEWIGNHYRIIGRPAEKATELHWKRLRSWAGRNAERIPRSGPVDGPGAEIYAFPTALRAIRAGATRSPNPF
jgi:hypothetical protein